MQLVVLASGKGSRLNYKDKVPKIFVKVNKKTIFDLNKKFFSFFRKKVIILGYGFKNCKKFLINENFKTVKNPIYYKTNMVHSLFCAKKQIKDNILICYGDVFFDWRIIRNFLNKNNNQNLIILKENWLNLWKKRMNIKKIYNDAENVVVKSGKLLQIGDKIKTKLPKYQFMGIIKLKKSDYFKLYRFYNLLKNQNIDFTTFLNLAINQKIIKVNTTTTKRFWFEIDSKKDLNILSKFINDKKII